MVRVPGNGFTAFDTPATPTAVVTADASGQPVESTIIGRRVAPGDYPVPEPARKAVARVELDGGLARQAARGDAAAAEELLAALRPGVLRYCWARIGSLGPGYISPDDVAQDVCLAVFEALPRYQDRGLPFAAFVFRIAANKVADAYRAASVAASMQSIEAVPDLADDAGWDPERQAVVADLSRRVGRLLAELPDQHREIIVLRVAVGLSANEVGAVLGMAPAAVRMAQSRALARLRTWARTQVDEVVA